MLDKVVLTLAYMEPGLVFRLSFESHRTVLLCGTVCCAVVVQIVKSAVDLKAIEQYFMFKSGTVCVTCCTKCF